MTLPHNFLVVLFMLFFARTTFAASVGEVTGECVTRSNIGGNWYLTEGVDPACEQNYRIDIENGAWLPTRYRGIARSGGSSIKFQVPSESNGISNAAYLENRVEMRMASGVPLVADHWARFSILLQDNFPGPDAWFVFFQIWQRNAGNPVADFALSTEPNPRLKIEIRNDEYPIGSGVTVYTDNESMRRGLWHDFVVHVRGGVSNNAVMQVWRRIDAAGCFSRIVDVAGLNIGKTRYPPYTQAQTIALEDMVVYPKVGIYRGGSTLNHQVWFDEIGYGSVKPGFRECSP